MYSSYKNCIITLNGSGIIADRVGIDVKANLQDNYHLNRKFSQGAPSPATPVGGKFNVGYYLTGEDPLQKHIYLESSGISGEFGGVNFSSGYLTSYSVRFNPNQPVYVNASIDFFDHFSGQFIPQSETLDSQNILNVSDISINGTGLGSLSSVRSASLEFKNEVKASYEVYTGESTTNIRPDRILFGKKELTSNISFDNYSGDLSIYGEDCSVAYSLADRDGTRQAQYSLRGKTDSKNLRSSSDGVLGNTFSVKQTTSSETTSITSFWPGSGLPGELVTITGVNFHNDPTVCIGDYCNIQVFYINDTTIQFIVPDITVPSGTINTRRTDSDEIEDETDDNFIVIRPVISVGGIFRRD